MPQTFTTRELDASGKVVTGSYQADSREIVARMVREKGNRPIAIEIHKESLANKEVRLFTPRASVKQLSMFCRQMYTMLRAGMPLLTALDVLEGQMADKHFAAVIRDLSIRVQKGEVFSDAMRAQGSYFPSILLSMVASGELTGNLDEVMERMSVHFVKEHKINNKIKSATRYPVVVSLFALGAVVFLMTNVVPVFVKMFEDAGAPLPGVTRVVVGISNSLMNHWYIYLAVIGALVIGIKAALQNDNIRYHYDRLLLNIPGIKKPVAQIATSRFTRTLSTLMSSGVQLLTAIESASVVTGNSYVIAQIDSVSEDVRKGVQLAPLLARTGVFPKMMTSMVSIGEESGSLEDMLEKTADFYDEELDAALTALVSLVEPAMIIIVGGIVGTIVIAMMLPLLTLFTLLE